MNDLFHADDLIWILILFRISATSLSQAFDFPLFLLLLEFGFLSKLKERESYSLKSLGNNHCRVQESRYPLAFTRMWGNYLDDFAHDIAVLII